MATLEFRELSFRQEKEKVICTFQSYFQFEIELADLRKIGDAKIGDSKIEFAGVSEKSVTHKFQRLLDRGFERLKSLNGRPAYYIHRNSQIPLIGSQYFGLVDRNSSLIELRPMTGCNLNCIYCSVDEGHGKKQSDYFVEASYLIDEFRTLVEWKGCEVEAHINPQGEPLLYKPLPELIKGLKEIPQVKKISIDTNGTMLTKALIDKLAAAGLSQFNVSLNAMSRKTATSLAGCPYDSSKVLDFVEYASSKAKVLLAPILVPGYNEAEIKLLIRHAKEKGIRICIQNYLVNKHGRNPVKPLDMEEFYRLIESWEKEYGTKLKFTALDFDVMPTKKLPMPFNKGDRVKADIVLPGRLKGEHLAVSKGRVIQVRNPLKNRGNVLVEITRTKHNIFYAK